MKNQYFGDRRDFVKYDLLLELVEGAPGIRQLTNIPMLTPDDGTGEGNVVSYVPGDRRPYLYDFLRSCLTKCNRTIRNLHAFFEERGIAYHGHRDDTFYRHESRDEYFASVPSLWLQDAVVFVDPDTGIQSGGLGYMRRAGIDRYLWRRKDLFWDNIAQVAERMNSASVMVVYQHLQRNANLVVRNVEDKSLKWCELTGIESAAAVDDGDVAFLVGSRSTQATAHMAETLPRYAELHGLRYHSFASLRQAAAVEQA